MFLSRPPPAVCLASLMRAGGESLTGTRFSPLPADEEAPVDYAELLKIVGPRSFTRAALARLAVQVLKENQQGSSASGHFSVKAAG